MAKKLLVTTMPFEFSPEQISESIEKNSGKLLVRGILQKASEQNQNGRVYSRPLLEREAGKYNELIKDRRALGELDHPESSVVNLQNVSHNVTKMWWEGDSLHGDVEVLGTPAGNILKELFKSGITLGISSRGMGTTRESEGKTLVNDDFELVAFDFVSNPSTRGAFLEPVNINESVSLESKVITDGRVCTEYCKIEGIVHEILGELGEM
nr:hypothetical protein [uncultured Mediterranean phage uvMED]|tara:strand:+ start:203 stop:832 length:630 start_codon:yes stop_codon:yes gene_type:complete